MRESLDYIPSSIHVMDPQGDALARFLRYKYYKVNSEDIFTIHNFVCPEWMLHILDVRSNDPAGFSFVRYDERCLFEKGRDFTGHCIGEMCDSEYIKKYDLARRTGAPQFSLECISANPRRSYLRYMAPLINSEGMSQILIASKYKMIEDQYGQVTETLGEYIQNGK